MQRFRIVLLAIFIIAFVVAASFSALLYHTNNSYATNVNIKSSSIQISDGLNGTLGNYFLDNFTKDST
ncbi:MAG: hypothetical protein ACP5OC_08695, partial [Thermoplasmata archaeon]